MAMNLGEERLHAVTASRPELVHTSSAHSIAASDDYYYSFSDRSSEASSDEATTVIRHRSPEETRQLNPPRPQQSNRPIPQPSHSATTATVSPESHREFPLTPTRERPAATFVDQSPVSPTETAVRHVSSIRAGDETPRPTTMVSAIDDDPTPVPRPTSRFDPYQDRVSLQSSNPAAVAEQPSDDHKPTSSVVGAVLSSNPNVQIDRGYSMRSSDALPTSSYNNNQQGWRSSIAQPVPTPGVDTTPELHFALDQLTRDEEIRGVGRYSTESWGLQASRPDTRDSIQHGTTADPRISEDPRASRGSDTRPLVSTERPKSLTPPRKPVPVRATPEAFVSTPVADVTQFPRDLQSRTHRQSAQSWLSAASDADTGFQKDAKFNSVPGPLRPVFLLPFILLCMFILAGLVVSSVHSALSYGMSRYDGTGTSLYFVYRYLAQLFAAVAIVWLHVVQKAIQRVLPFVLIRSQSRNSRGEVLRTTPLFLSNYLLPHLGPFKHREIGLGICNIIFWFTALFTVPLASALYTPMYLSSNGHGYWRWSTVQAVCWTLIPIYFLLIIALIFVLLKFNLRPTGLRWDPRSIADLLVLLRRLNNTINRLSTNSRTGHFDYRPASLGLWRSSTEPNSLSYGIGVPRDVEEGIEPELRPESQRTTLQPRRVNAEEGLHHQSTFESWKSGQNGRDGWLPWFLRPSPVALWIAISLVLLIAFLVVSFVNRAVQNGFDPQLSAGPLISLNFSSANFLWSFLPALLGMFLYLFWLPFDAYFSALQPYADMQSESGADATKSVLLEYGAEVPIIASIQALINGHFRVAWISFVSLVAITIPVLAGGVFQAQYVIGTTDTIHEIASLPGYIALCVFVGIYALSFPVLWPSRRYRLPENIKYVSSIGDFVIGGRMMNESTWRGPQTKSDLVGRLMSRGLTGEKGAGNGLFHFGYYVDIEGRERIGIYRD